MTRPMSPAMQEKLRQLDESQAWQDYPKDVLRVQVAALRMDYGNLPDVRIAQFLMEQAGSLQNVLSACEGDQDTELAGQLRAHIAGMCILACAVSRERRGKPAA